MFSVQLFPITQGQLDQQISCPIRLSLHGDALIDKRDKVNLSFHPHTDIPNKQTVCHGQHQRARGWWGGLVKINP